MSRPHFRTWPEHIGESFQYPSTQIISSALLLYVEVAQLYIVSEPKSHVSLFGPGKDMQTAHGLVSRGEF
jgi:hypothetical protein